MGLAIGAVDIGGAGALARIIAGAPETQRSGTEPGRRRWGYVAPRCDLRACHLGVGRGQMTQDPEMDGTRLRSMLSPKCNTTRECSQTCVG
jgi:hypothetical protein